MSRNIYQPVTCEICQRAEGTPHADCEVEMILACPACWKRLQGIKRQLRAARLAEPVPIAGVPY